MGAIAGSIMILILWFLTAIGILFFLASFLCLFFVGRKKKRETGKKLKRHYVPFIIFLCMGLIFVTPYSIGLIQDGINNRKIEQQRLENDKESKERDPLNFAIRKGDIDTVIEFLEAGTDPNEKQIESEASYFLLACACVTDKSYEIVELMLEYGGEINPAEGRSPLMAAMENSYSRKGYKKSKKESEKEKKIILSVIELLLQHGADPNVREKGANDYTPLMKIALYTGFEMSDTRFDVASLLLEYGADIDAALKGGDTALIIACGHSYVFLDCVSFLLENGSDTSIINSEGKTARDILQGKYEDEVNRINGGLGMSRERAREYEKIFKMFG